MRFLSIVSNDFFTSQRRNAESLKEAREERCAATQNNSCGHAVPARSEFVR